MPGIITLIIGLAIAALLMVAEHLLCVKFKNPLWGGILPLICLIATIFIFASGKLQANLRILFPFILFNSFMIGDWVNGRENYKKKQKAEIDKMKAHDIIS